MFSGCHGSQRGFSVFGISLRIQNFDFGWRSAGFSVQAVGFRVQVSDYRLNPRATEGLARRSLEDPDCEGPKPSTLNRKTLGAGGGGKGGFWGRTGLGEVPYPVRVPYEGAHGYHC